MAPRRCPHSPQTDTVFRPCRSMTCAQPNGARWLPRIGHRDVREADGAHIRIRMTVRSPVCNHVAEEPQRHSIVVRTRQPASGLNDRVSPAQATVLWQLPHAMVPNVINAACRSPARRCGSDAGLVAMIAGSRDRSVLASRHCGGQLSHPAFVGYARTPLPCEVPLWQVAQAPMTCV